MHWGWALWGSGGRWAGWGRGVSVAEGSSEGGEGGGWLVWFGEIGQEGERDVEAKRVRGGAGGAPEDIGRVEGWVIGNEKGVIDGGASAATKGEQGGGGSTQGMVVKVAEAEANGARAGHASGGECSSKGDAGGVGKDGFSHHLYISEELH